MWTPLKKIIPQAASRLRVGEGLKQGDFLNNWDQHIGTCLGEGFKKKSKPVSFKNKILVIDCLNSVWASEFNLRREKLMRWLKKKLGRDKIEKIKIIS